MDKSTSGYMKDRYILLSIKTCILKLFDAPKIAKRILTNGSTSVYITLLGIITEYLEKKIYRNYLVSKENISSL